MVEKSLATEGCPCLMRSEPVPKILRFARLVCSGVDGIREEISQALYNFSGTEVQYLEELLKYYKIAVTAEGKTKTTKGNEVIDVVMTQTEGRMLSPVVEGMEGIEVPEEMIESRDDPESLFAPRNEEGQS